MPDTNPFERPSAEDLFPPTGAKLPKTIVIRELPPLSNWCYAERLEVAARPAKPRRRVPQA